MSLLKSIFDAVKTVVSGIRKVNVPTLLLDVIGYIPSIVSTLSYLIKKDQKTWQEWKDIVDKELEGFDAVTGDTGLKLIPNIPAPYQEEALDHIKELLRILMYNKIGVPEYTTQHNPTE